MRFHVGFRCERPREAAQLIFNPSSNNIHSLVLQPKQYTASWSRALPPPPTPPSLPPPLTTMIVLIISFPNQTSDRPNIRPCRCPCPATASTNIGEGTRQHSFIQYWRRNPTPVVLARS
jgi:hypothetical protein